MLDNPFTDSDIRDALFSIDVNKTPGPDGFTSGFFTENWDILGTELCAVVKNFFNKGQMLTQVNSTLISLIPKGKNPSSVSDYRPISCCSTIYKTISKLLAKRLSWIFPP